MSQAGSRGIPMGCRRHEPSGDQREQGVQSHTATLVQWLPFRKGLRPILKTIFSISASPIPPFLGGLNYPTLFEENETLNHTLPPVSFFTPSHTFQTTS